MLYEPKHASESLGGLIKIHVSELHIIVSDSVGWEGGENLYFKIKFPYDTAAAALTTTLWEPLHKTNSFQSWLKIRIIYESFKIWGCLIPTSD